MKFIDAVRNENTDAVLLGGDIGVSDSVCEFLKEFDDNLDKDIYFVLGNHDYYAGSIEQVRLNVSNLARSSLHLNWLPDIGIKELTSDTALIGHGSWADGRLDNLMESDLVISDYLLIKEFNPSAFMPSEGKDVSSYLPASSLMNEHHTKLRRLKKMNQFGDEAAKHVQKFLTKALEFYDRVIFLTHVPPFKESCLNKDRFSNDEALPYYTCKAVGDVLIQTMKQHPKKHLTVLCGHIHKSSEVSILPNLLILTGSATYYQPEIQKVLEIS